MLDSLFSESVIALDCGGECTVSSICWSSVCLDHPACPGSAMQQVVFWAICCAVHRAE